jgi:hypothetical protein
MIERRMRLTAPTFEGIFRHRELRAATTPGAFGRPHSEDHVCILCASKPEGSPVTVSQSKVLQLLALLEHPHALPADLALRLAGRLLELTQPEHPALRCDAVGTSGSDRNG